MVEETLSCVLALLERSAAAAAVVSTRDR